MSDYKLLITTENRWIFEDVLTTRLAADFPGTQLAYDLTSGSAFRVSGFIPDPLPRAPHHRLQANLLDDGTMITFDDASLEKIAELTTWVLATFPVPPGAEVMLWYLDDPWTIAPGVTQAEIITRFRYDG